MTTGSYEGYLPMEGILDHHEAFSFTRSAHGGLGVLSHPPTRDPKPKAEDAARTCSSCEGERGARVNEGSRQGCQRLDRINAVGTIRPRW